MPAGLARLAWPRAVALLASPAAGRRRCQEPPPELRRDVFRVDTEVVLLDVVVRDKKGRSVRDLRPEEIEVYEDGVRQQVGQLPLPRLARDRRGPRGRAGRGAFRRGRAAAAAPPKPGESRHLNLVTLLFDQLGPDGRSIARKAALSFLELENRPDVYVSVFQIGESLRLLQQFTTDRDSARTRRSCTRPGQLDTQYTPATDRLAEAAGAGQRRSATSSSR